MGAAHVSSTGTVQRWSRSAPCASGPADLPRACPHLLQPHGWPSAWVPRLQHGSLSLGERQCTGAIS